MTYDYKAIIYEAEQQRKGLYEFTGFYGLRPYLTHLYKPLSDEDWEVSPKRFYNTPPNLISAMELKFNGGKEMNIEVIFSIEKERENAG